MKSFFSNLIFFTFLLCAGAAYAVTSGTTVSGTIPAGDVSNQSFSASSGQGD